MSAGLRLGPMLRHVSESSATIWVETEAPGQVTVTAGAHTASSATFTVHGHHYALCDLDGLAPGSALPYEVRVDDTPVWPEPESVHPPSLIRTIDPDRPARIVFGSCHTPTDHSPNAVVRYGVDMVRAYSLRLAAQRRGAATPPPVSPDGRGQAPAAAPAHGEAPGQHAVQGTHPGQGPGSLTAQEPAQGPAQAHDPSQGPAPSGPGQGGHDRTEGVSGEQDGKDRKDGHDGGNERPQTPTNPPGDFSGRPERTSDLDGHEPELLLMIGDQVYADEIQPSMVEFLRQRRAAKGGDEAQPPDDEVVFFDEYAELYRQAWADPDVRWLMSTVPTLMIFDDHDVRDDWNTSGTWRTMMAKTPWWAPRITAGLGAYWLYQHLGNMSAEARDADPVLARVRAHGADAEEVVDEFAWRSHNEPSSYQWSYRYDIGRNRIVVMDTRCSRDVADDSMRSILGGDGYAWLDEQMTGDVDHLVLASTLPFLMPVGVHYLEAWNEAVCAGAWGRWMRKPAEKLRQEIDLEHWPAFQRSFRAVSDSVMSVASGQRGRPPATVLFLGGDVHFSYLARAQPADPKARSAVEGTRIVQLVCSPTCNWMQPALRRMMWVSVRSVTALLCRLMARTAGVHPPSLRWKLDAGPWYDNALATLTLTGREAEVQWEHSPLIKRTIESLTQVDLQRPKVSRLTRFRLTAPKR